MWKTNNSIEKRIIFIMRRENSIIYLTNKKNILIAKMLQITIAATTLLINGM